MLLTAACALGASAAPDENFHIYLCLGQSNMEGAAPIEACDSVGINPRFKTMACCDYPDNRVMGEWYDALPPLTRKNTGLGPSDYFGRAMADAMPENVKIGLLTVAVGGCSIDLYDPALADEYLAKQPDWMKYFASAYEGRPYDRLVAMARKAQNDGVIKGIIFHQGETNTADPEWPGKVKALYERLLSDLGLDAADVPFVAGEVLSAESGGICAAHNPLVNSLPEVIPGARVVSSAGLPGQPDGLHFTSAAYRELGRRYAAAMLDARSQL